MRVCPKCQGFIIIEHPPFLRHIKAVRCLICGLWEEEGATLNRLHHAAWVREDNPRAGIVKDIRRARG